MKSWRARSSRWRGDSVRSALTAWLFAALSFCAVARDAVPLADDPALEARVLAIAGELRCLVCQNQTVADSNADLAVDLRKQIGEKLRQGMSERQILDFMVARYGDFVLYRPPLRASTLLLWSGPFALLAIGAWVLARVLRRRRHEAAAALSLADAARARHLLAGGGRLPLEETAP
jgi:cytochrome c-type biogenesis protein CcmH